MIKFTSREIWDILISMIVIAGTFAYVFRGINNGDFISLIPITMVAAGLGFLLHELAHKFVAMSYGYYAQYQLWVQGLLFAILTAAFFGVVMALPGAVYTYGNMSVEENGKISVAGPLVNIILAIIFFVLLQLVTFSQVITTICFLGFFINSFLAFLNLIPVSILDGTKIIKWNPIVWGITMFISFLLMIPYILSVISYLRLF